MKIKMLLSGFAASLALPAVVLCSAICPTTIENDPPATSDACSILITVGSNGHVSLLETGTGAYDGASSSTFGVVNNLASPLTGLSLSGTGGLTAFQGNGIRQYLPANGIAIPDPGPILQGYEDYYGPDTTFSSVDFANDSLIVNFLAGLAPGASTYFSLPVDPDTAEAMLSRDGAIVALAQTSVPEVTSAGYSLAGAAALFLLAAATRRTRTIRP